VIFSLCSQLIFFKIVEKAATVSVGPIPITEIFT
jgi:hypothetical protein